MKNILIQSIAFFLLFGNMNNAQADLQPNLTLAGKVFYSDSKKVRAVIDSEGTSFSVFKNKVKQYSSEPYPDLKLGILFISNDGSHIIWMLAPDGFYGIPSSNTYDRLTALIFYENGKVLKTYSLAQLLVRKDLVNHSKSHTQWIMVKRTAGLDDKGVSVNFAPDGSFLKLETTSFRKYDFNPKTGEMTSGEDSSVYQKADLIIEGKITHIENRENSSAPCSFQITALAFIKGESKNTTPLYVKDETCSYTWENFPATVALRKINNQWWVSDPIYSTP